MNSRWIFLLCLLCSHSTHAQVFNEKSLKALRGCTGGWASQDDSVSAHTERRGRGNLFLLDQRAGEPLTCPSPRKDIVVWFETPDDSHVDATFLVPQADGSAKMQKYRFDLKDVQSRPAGVFEIPETKTPCVINMFKDVGVDDHLLPQDSVRTRITTWSVTPPENGPRKKVARRFAVESLAPDPKARALKAAPLDPPSADKALGEIVDHVMLTLSAIPIIDVDNAATKKTIQACREFADLMAKKTADDKWPVSTKALDALESVLLTREGQYLQKNHWGSPKSLDEEVQRMSQGRQ